MLAQIKTKVRKSLAPISSARRNLRNEQAWKRGGYASPAPRRVKQAVLKRHHISGGTWVETGTWMGDTTDFLSGIADHVWSIEPEPKLAASARERFLHRANVTIVEGLSEDHLGQFLSHSTVMFACGSMAIIQRATHFRDPWIRQSQRNSERWKNI